MSNTAKNTQEIPCCGADLTFPDMSNVENPKNPKDTISKEFLNEFETDFKDFDIGYVNDLTGLFLHDYNSDFSSAIVISIEMYDRILESEIGIEAEKANNELYENFGNITYFISDYLRENGFETCVAHPHEEKINFTKIAEKSKNGNCRKKRAFNFTPFWTKTKK